jgi:hypothetical protein
MAVDDGDQLDLLSSVDDLRLVQFLLADLHDDLKEKIARFRQLSDLSAALGSSGTMIPGGETTYTAWTEARTSFIHGNFIATVLLCQGLAEHLLSAHLALGLAGESLPNRVSFHETLRRCIAKRVISNDDSNDLQRLMGLRNPLSHYRNIDDPSNLSRRVLDSMIPAENHLFSDASFAISMAVRLLALPSFRLGD